MATCQICGAEEEIKFLPLYVSGSEGIDICHDCEMHIVEYLRSLIRLAFKSRKIGYANCRKIKEAKEVNK